MEAPGGSVAKRLPAHGGRWLTSACLLMMVLASPAAFALPPTGTHIPIRADQIHQFLLNRDPGATLRIVAPTGVRALLVQDTSIALRAREILAVQDHSSYKISRVGGQTRWNLPYQFLVPTRAVGVSPGPSQPQHLRLAALIEGGGLRFQPAIGAFMGILLIGLEDVDRPASAEPLPSPIHIQLVADVDAVDPGELTLEGTNVAGFKPVKLKQIEARDSVRVHIRPEFDPTGSDIWVPVQRSEVKLSVSPPKIQGFGLEVATLLVQLPPGIRPDGHVVFTPSAGNLDPNDVPTGTGVVKSFIRSRGHGQAHVTATCAPFRSGSTEVEFVWPFAFVIAALLGGLLGGAVGQRDVIEKSWRSGLAHVLTGVGVGVIVAGAYAAGINLLPATLTVNTTISEVAVFVVAAIGGALGLPYLKAVVPGIRQGLEGK